jgi:hypothetical protein
MTEGTPSRKAESDVQEDPQRAATRETGGVPDKDHPDQHTTTGTTPSGTFVGRVAGDDTGAGEETGAERRAAHQDGSAGR